MVSTHQAASQFSTHNYSNLNEQSQQQSAQSNLEGAQEQRQSFLVGASSLMSLPMVRTPSYNSLTSQISCSSLSLEDATPLYYEKTNHEPNFKGAQCFSWTFQQSRDSQYTSSSSLSGTTVSVPDSAKPPADDSKTRATNTTGRAQQNSGSQVRGDLTNNLQSSNKKVKKTHKKSKGAELKTANVSGRIMRSGWRPEEDALIKRAVSAHKGSAFTQWGDLAKQMPNRIGKQVRDRWVNYLNPALDHKKFTQKDDLKLWRAVKAKGSRWSEISSEYFACAKSENQLKNRWHSAEFRKYIKGQLLKEKA